MRPRTARPRPPAAASSAAASGSAGLGPQPRLPRALDLAGGLGRPLLAGLVLRPRLGRRRLLHVARRLRGGLACACCSACSTPSTTVSSAVRPSASVASVGLVQQPGLDRLLRTGVAALAHAGALADAVAQVVELGPPHVAARRQLDALDLRRVHREHALDADPEGLLAHGEGLTRAVALALDHDPLEDLDAAARPLDHLEVDAHAVARREARNAAQLRALDVCDDAAHEI